MARCGAGGQWPPTWISLCLPLLTVLRPQGISAQIRYSVQEEAEAGTAVGNVAKDLGLDVGRLPGRNLRVLSGTKREPFEVNQSNGVLAVGQRLDREDLCGNAVPCVINLKVVVENPLEMHRVLVEVLDVNDNWPRFLDDKCALEVLESAVVGSKLQVEGAQDLDVGLNSVQTYRLSQNPFFHLETEDFGEDGGKAPFLVLQRPLDREKTARHRLLLTAADGGKPPKTGTMNITVIVSDVNDNAPACERQKYSITVEENAAVATYLLTVKASDSDEGLNGEVEYSLRSKLRGLHSLPFDLDQKSGELTLKEVLDFEARQVYEMKVLAADKGAVSLSVQCTVVVRVQDVNDNPPKIDVTSLASRIAEDAPLGTVVALVAVQDLDSGVNGQVVCGLRPEGLPFALEPAPDGQSYSLVTKEYLDKEREHVYDVTITAKDLGVPPMSATKVINVDVLDVNDNRPLFTESPYTFYVPENNKAGVSLFSVSAADADAGENAAVTYSFQRKSESVTSFLNINEVTGDVSALKSLDFEALKSFQFQVSATDGGSPPLSGNVTVKVFILDQNDNAPVIVYPLSSNGSAQGAEEIPRNSKAGDLVTRVRAYDADTGYNGWLLFSLHPPGERALFSLDRYTGQIRTLRSFTETDEAEHRLLVLVKDNGDVSLSATATVTVKLAEPKEAFAASDHVQSAAEADRSEDRLTFYLALTLGSVSLLLVISVVVLIAMRCSKSTEYTSKYLQDPHYDGTLCHSIQYRSGDKRYMLVGPRMSIGSAVVPGSRANTLLMSDAAGEVRQNLLFFLLR
ncbi:protocadherin alpha-6-like [Syngnathoides biaculeatus]|uniref:protocadherin alpha-6-like n=1 Tax=Syngnathoides biaculeatus TaxID=300417 RepID=UPI002ADD8ECC|nr:protocadherin alpha-6-like [Syngnathoides biaculeatus]